MKKCLIIINTNSGGSAHISFEKVERCLGSGYSYTRFSLPDDGTPDYNGYDALAVCGGDGTLNNVLREVCDKSVQLYYFPSGTLNDKAKAERYHHRKTACPSTVGHNGKPVVIGDYGTGIFTYVFATGTFTPIGYIVSADKKKKFGILAYVTEILRQFKPAFINATIDCGNRTYEGEFTLIMFLKSPRCFGFCFNKDFDADSESGHFVAIRSPKHKGLLGAIEIFFPFFRVFFVGLKEERDDKIIFTKISQAKVISNSEICYCKDGEKQVCKDEPLQIHFKRTQCRFSVIDKF